MSIRRWLLLWLLLGLLVSTAVAACAVYARARAEARDIFDAQLELIAGTFPVEGFGPAVAPPANSTDNGNVVVVRIWDENGAQRYLSNPNSSAPDRADVGFSTVTAPGGSWRVYTAFVGNNLVQVSQPMNFREEFAAALAWRTLLPLLVLLPVLMALVWFTVGTALRPLNEVAVAVGRRSAIALEPLPEGGLPSEVRPLVTALNALLGLLAQALQAQRSFIADAAHEMRTPLTAVQLQIQLLERADDDAKRKEALAQLKAGVERTSRLVRQLLSLARSEREGAEQQPFIAVDLGGVARQVVADLAPIAAAKNIELGLTNDAAALVNGDADALRMLVTNLADNAIQYTPAGGTVDVAVNVAGRHACLVVTDSGPGIPAAARERVFDRFYRHESTGVTGSGLGLAIVRKVAERHGAAIELGDGPLGSGLKVTVRFPAA